MSSNQLHPDGVCHSDSLAASTNVPMQGKTISVNLSRSALSKLQQLEKPLCVEMELYFSCLIRKQVRIREQLESPFTVTVNQYLQLGFRPVMTKTCSVSSCDGEAPPLSDFPIKKPQSYIPGWLTLDYKKGQWLGEFGY